MTSNKAQKAIDKLKKERAGLERDHAAAARQAEELRAGMGAAIVGGQSPQAVAEKVRAAEDYRDAVAAGLKEIDAQIEAVIEQERAATRAADLAQAAELEGQYDAAVRKMIDALAGFDAAELERLAYQSHNLAAKHGESRAAALNKARRRAAGTIGADLERLRHELHQWLRVAGG